MDLTEREISLLNAAERRNIDRFGFIIALSAFGALARVTFQLVSVPLILASNSKYHKIETSFQYSPKGGTTTSRLMVDVIR